MKFNIMNLFGGSGAVRSGNRMQHVALLTNGLPKTVDALQMGGILLMTAPNGAYYEMLEERPLGHGQSVGELQARGILLDGTIKGDTLHLLLQIFSETLLGPVFYEFIKRKGDKGFGEGAFNTLFESFERDRIRRGALILEEAK